MTIAVDLGRKATQKINKKPLDGSSQIFFVFLQVISTQKQPFHGLVSGNLLFQDGKYQFSRDMRFLTL